MKGIGLGVMLTALMLSSIAWAESVLHQAGKSVGDFAAGLGASVSSGMQKSMQSNDPQWITIAPKPKEACLKESGGTLNQVYMRCRNGRQEYVRFDANGQKVVLSERAIPAYP